MVSIAYRIGKAFNDASWKLRDRLEVGFTKCVLFFFYFTSNINAGINYNYSTILEIKFVFLAPSGFRNKTVEMWNWKYSFALAEPLELAPLGKLYPKTHWESSGTRLFALSQAHVYFDTFFSPWGFSLSYQEKLSSNSFYSICYHNCI